MTEKRKIGEVTIERRKDGPRYWHTLSIGPSWCVCEASVGDALWTAAEHIEALQAAAETAEKR